MKTKPAVKPAVKTKTTKTVKKLSLEDLATIKAFSALDLDQRTRVLRLARKEDVQLVLDIGTRVVDLEMNRIDKSKTMEQLTKHIETTIESRIDGLNGERCFVWSGIALVLILVIVSLFYSKSAYESSKQQPTQTVTTEAHEAHEASVGNKMHDTIAVGQLNANGAVWTGVRWLGGKTNNPIGRVTVERVTDTTEQLLTQGAQQ